MATDAVAPAVVFVAGLASFFAPCILPVVPGYLAFVTGGPEARASRRLALTLAFVLGFGVSFVILGVLIGAVGSSAVFLASEAWLRRIGGALIIAFGLAMVGLLRLPFMDRDVHFHGKPPPAAGPVGGAVLLGAAFGVGWSPCVGPILASVLIFAGIEGGAGAGALLLSIYAAGLAIPFIIVGVTAERGAALLRRFARAARGVEIVGGLFLIALGIGVFTGALARLTSYVVGF